MKTSGLEAIAGAVLGLFWLLPVAAQPPPTPPPIRSPGSVVVPAQPPPPVTIPKPNTVIAPITRQPSPIPQGAQAGTPILETVYVPPLTILPLPGTVPARVTSISWAGTVDIQPTDSLQLRLRAPYPTTLVIFINGQPLPFIAAGARLPQPDDTGYFTVTAQPMPGYPDKVASNTAGYNWFFWVVDVKLPKALRFQALGVDVPPFTLTARDVGSGIQAAVPDLNLNIAGFTHGMCNPFCPLDPRSPTEVFLSGDNSKNEASFPNMPRATTGIVARRVTLAGWLSSSPSQNGDEDWHFEFYPDPDFIQRNYTDGAALPFAGAILPGQPDQSACWLLDHTNFSCSNIGCCNETGCFGAAGCAVKLPLTAPGAVPDVRSFILPAWDNNTLDAELNAWHVNVRGNPPPGYCLEPGTPDAWAFNVGSGSGVACPTASGPLARPLQAGDYVIVTGTLWQDSAHDHPGGAGAANSKIACFSHLYPAHGGWLEMHPPDVVRYSWPPPPLRKHVQHISSCVNDPRTAFVTNSPFTLKPVPEQPPTANSFLRVQQIPDPRFNLSNATIAAPLYDWSTNQAVTLGVQSPVGGGYASASYTFLLWWELGSVPRPNPPGFLKVAATINSQSPLALRVTVTDLGTNMPIAHAAVSVFDNSYNPLGSGMTNVDGTAIVNYSPCPALLGYAGSPPPSCNFKVVVPPAAGSYYAVEGSTPALAVKALLSGSTVQVTISDLLTNAAVQGAAVTVYNAQTGAQTATGVTSANGTASVPSTCGAFGAGNSCRVTANKGGYPACAFPMPATYGFTPAAVACQ